MAPPALHFSIEEQLRPITFEEYRALPDSELRVELIRGELVMSASPRARHQRVAFQLAHDLQDHADSLQLGEVFMAPFDVRLPGDTVAQPDILFASVAHKRRIGEDYCDGAPDLIVEVLSPSKRRVDLVQKRVLYAEFGVPEYWIVDPDAHTVSVNLIDGAHYAERIVAKGDLRSAAFPDFRFDFVSIFSVRPWMQKSIAAHEDDETDDH